MPLVGTTYIPNTEYPMFNAQAISKRHFQFLFITFGFNSIVLYRIKMEGKSLHAHTYRHNILLYNNNANNNLFVKMKKNDKKKTLERAHKVLSCCKSVSSDSPFRQNVSVHFIVQ